MCLSFSHSLPLQTLDVLLEEISQSLDEDMADLDEYEMGLENPDINYEYASFFSILKH